MSTLTLDDKGIIAPCPACGRRNRTPYAHLGETGNCGNCKADLPPPSEPIDIDQPARFDALIGASAISVVVDFWAPWCGPCRMVAPEIVKVAATAAGEIVVVKVDTEALPALAQRYQIQSIPTMAIFSHGQEVARTAGARPAPAILEFVRQSAV